MRYRLADVREVLSSALVLVGLAAFTAVTYLAVVAGPRSVVGTSDRADLALSVLATAMVALAFQPVRRTLERVVGRLLFGRRATAHDVLSGFATRVGPAASSPDALVELARLLSDGTGAESARVWLRVGSQLRPAAAWPAQTASRDGLSPVDIDEAAGLPALHGDLVVPVRSEGELLGALTVSKARGERLTEPDSDLVRRLAAASGVVLRNLRLDSELAERLVELESSRRRLLSAQTDAQRRIETELAGGTRAHLAELRARLERLAGDVDVAASPKTAALLGQLVGAVRGALETVDGLAAGIYPQRLAADGLVVALTEQVAKAGVPTVVRAVDVSRYPAEVEAAVYFSVLEALQNAAKYAGATSARVGLRQVVDQLRFEVTDDGVGFDVATAGKGAGLVGMADRLDSVGGSMTLDSMPGAGTTITGEVPA